MGLEQTTASHASVLSTGEILFTVLIALLLFDEHIKPIGYVGVILVLIAVFMITMNYNPQIRNQIFGINYGDVLIIISTLFWAMDNNISKIVSHKMNAKDSSAEISYRWPIAYGYSDCIRYQNKYQFNTDPKYITPWYWRIRSINLLLFAWFKKNWYN